MRTKLTKSVCLDLEPKDPGREEIYWDQEGTGLGVRVTRTRADGRRGRYFVFGYRTRIRPDEPPRKSKWRIYQIGSVTRWTLQLAKDEVVRLNALVNRGNDPVEDRRLARREAEQAKSMKELAVLIMERHHHTTWEEPPPIGRKKMEPKYAREDRARWTRWVLPRLGSKLIGDITTNDIDRLLLEVSKEAGTTTANRLRSMLSKALNLAEVWGLRPQNTNPVTHAVKHTEQQRQRILSREELVRVLDATDKLLEDARLPLDEGNGKARRESLSKQRQLLVIQLAAETMRRPDELFRLEWSWIRPEEQIIVLPKAKADRTGKRAKGQRFGLSERALDILRQAKGLAGDSRYVFPSIRSDGAHITTVRRMWAEILQEATIEDTIDLYSLKHCMISLSDEAGVQLGGVSDQAGHGDIRTTEIYRRGTDRQKVATANALSRYVTTLRESHSNSV